MRLERTPQLQLWLSVILLVLVLSMLLFVRDRHLTDGVVDCGDAEGPRPRIDLRNFQTHYMAYSLTLEGELTSGERLSAKIQPVELQELSESIQSGQEFRKSLVAGYNACAVKRDAFQSAISRFQSLDGLAKRIETLTAKSALGADDHKNLSSLIDQYVSITQALGAK